MTALALTVNGERRHVDVEPRTSLADLLRERLRLTGTHLGCEHGVCGACTVLVDGAPVRSCIVPAVACEGRNVQPIEAFEDDGLMEELREAFRREHGLQCGFCTPGMLIAARDVVLRIPGADEARIRRELAGNICRCTGYIGIVKAVQSVLRSRLGAQGATSPKSAPESRPAVENRGSSASPSSQPHQPSLRITSTSQHTAPVPSRVSAPAAHGEPARGGWTRFAESFVIEEEPATVWKVLSDFPVVASCLPGAELTEHGDGHIKGRMTVKLGPMRAAFAGSANVEIDDRNRCGRIRGAGNDSGSGSRTRANATYTVEPNPSGTGSLVSLAVEYNLQGPLAQFSRSGLAQDLGRRLTKEFSTNLRSKLRGGEPTQADGKAAPINAGNMLLEAVKAWLRRLLRSPKGST